MIVLALPARRAHRATTTSRSRGFFKHLWIYVVLFALRPAGGDRRVDDRRRSATPIRSTGWPTARSFDLWRGRCCTRAQFLVARVLLPRLPAAGPAPRARRERDLRDDRAVLHDPLRQAAARDARRDRRRPDPRHARDAHASIWGGVLIHVGVAIDDGRARAARLPADRRPAVSPLGHPAPTERLAFRHWRAGDLPLAMALWGDPTVSRAGGRAVRRRGRRCAARHRAREPARPRHQLLADRACRRRHRLLRSSRAIRPRGSSSSASTSCRPPGAAGTPSRPVRA